MVGVLGIEPSLHEPESCVLPVYDTPTSQLVDTTRFASQIRAGLHAAPLRTKIVLAPLCTYFCSLTLVL